MSPALRAASWNINAASERRFVGQLAFLLEEQIDLALLQEVHRDRNRTGIALAAGWPIVMSSHDVPDERPGRAGADHRLGCMILGGARLRPISDPQRLPSLPGSELPAPERTLAVQLSLGGAEFSAASLYTVTGDRRSIHWGPEAKQRTHAAWVGWMQDQRERSIVGLDANSPKVDHPDETENVYWGEEYGFDFQRERLLFDPRHAPHVLRDAYRRFLEQTPERLVQIRKDRPQGPLAVSHVNLRRERRYDFLFVTPDVQIVEVAYLSEVLAPRSGTRLSDHAPVIATLKLSG